MAVDPALAFASVGTLGKQLREKEFTAVELAEFFLDRLKKLGPKYNAVVTVTRELALAQAKQADADFAAGRDRGPLHGIPYGAKDLLATRGIPTSWGAAPLKDQMFDGDATVIVRLRSAGAVLVAKLAMVEIAGGLGYRQANASFTGPGLNPWNVARWSGGSSSGPGSAVAAGLVPFAIGSETWGSIMNPAAQCGITGLRPTYGRVSRHGAMALSWTMDKLGPMARTADDCGLVLAAIAGRDPADATSSPREYAYPPREKLAGRFRLATLRGADESVQPEVRENYRKSLEVLREFATFEEIELPDLPYGTVAGTIISCEMAAAFEELVTSGDVWEMTAPEDRWGAHAALVIPAKDYINALRLRAKMQRELDAVLAKYDAVVTPTLATVAPPIDAPFGEYGRGFAGTEIGGAGNAAGVPAITVPNGFGEEGLPTGLQFVGRAFEETRLLALADAYQAKTDWHTRRPEVPASS
ncbi:MAG: amidase [Planctomycetaceae bacterium]